MNTGLHIKRIIDKSYTIFPIYFPLRNSEIFVNGLSNVQGVFATLMPVQCETIYHLRGNLGDYFE